MSDDILEAESTIGVGACYNDGGFTSMGSVIATGENSFTYTTDKEGEQSNSWEEEFDAFKDEADGFDYRVFHESIPG